MSSNLFGKDKRRAFTGLLYTATPQQGEFVMLPGRFGRKMRSIFQFFCSVYATRTLSLKTLRIVYTSLSL
jgi:hypothetical protein